MQTEVETGGVWPGARNTWSSWGLERGAPQNPTRQAILPDTLILNFQLLEQQGKEFVPDPDSSRRTWLTWLWLSAPSLPSGVCFLKLESGTGHLCYSMSWCQVTVLFWPDSD